ncbi:divalent-cation tolerance protein CutA [Spirillospora sp. NPDC048911]|uniref:divalent-cation tolerance protein CutA n=1 Tax=Spirillospora sp. NPDC048911 TaxID=3364527 RepID=UPI003719B8E5
MNDHLLVTTTVHSREAAIELLRSAVRAKLAASGQVLGPAVSVFWHKGDLEQSEEWQLSLRTTAARFEKLEAHLIEAHPWENPEVTYMKIDGAG